MAGMLTVAGTGISAIVQITRETEYAIERAEKVFFLTNGSITAQWLCKRNPSAESLHRFYESGQPREATYEAMTEAIMGSVRNGANTCALFYGHPGVFVAPSHEAIRRARQEGFEARMLPAVSAEDCLLSDLGFDPGVSGCQSFEATDFLLYRRRFDTRSHLILWQVGVVGETLFSDQPKAPGLGLLVDELENHYGADHEVVTYQAAEHPILQPTIATVPLRSLGDAALDALTTLYVPPVHGVPDQEMRDKLDL